MNKPLAALVAVALLVLPACSARDMDNAFAGLCNAVPIADAGFQYYASTGKVSASVIRSEARAVAAAQAVCNGPRPTNVQSAMAAVRAAIVAIAAETAKARAQAGPGPV